MAGAEAIDLISVEDYLEGEKQANSRHEYLHGLVIAMAGASRRHNTIALNIASALNQELQGGACRPFIGDLKVGIERSGGFLFYYPDIVVECRSALPEDDNYTTEPKVIIEVLSPSTERIDRGEKLWAHQTLESLEEYVLVAQHVSAVTVYRKADQWQPAHLTDSDTFQLPSIDFEMPLPQIYASVDFDAPPN